MNNKIYYVLGIHKRIIGTASFANDIHFFLAHYLLDLLRVCYFSKVATLAIRIFT